MKIEDPLSISWETFVRVGIRGDPGVIDGYVTICPVAWLQSNVDQLPLLGRWHIIVADLDEEAIAIALDRAIGECASETLSGVLRNLSQLLRLDLFGSSFAGET